MKDNTELYLLDENAKRARIGDRINYWETENSCKSVIIAWSEIDLCVKIGNIPFHQIPKPFKFRITKL